MMLLNISSNEYMIKMKKNHRCVSCGMHYSGIICPNCSSTVSIPVDVKKEAIDLLKKFTDHSIWDLHGGFMSLDIQDAVRFSIVTCEYLITHSINPEYWKEVIEELKHKK